MGNQKGKVLAPPAGHAKASPCPGARPAGSWDVRAPRRLQPSALASPAHPSGVPGELLPCPAPRVPSPFPADTSVVAAEPPRPPTEALFLTLSHLVPEGHVLTSPVGKPVSSMI